MLLDRTTKSEIEDRQDTPIFLSAKPFLPPINALETIFRWKKLDSSIFASSTCQSGHCAPKSDNWRFESYERKQSANCWPFLLEGWTFVPSNWMVEIPVFFDAQYRRAKEHAILGCSQSGLRSDRTESKLYIHSVLWHDRHCFQASARTNLQRLRSAKPKGSVAWLIARPAFLLCSFAQDAIQTKAVGS